MSFPRSTSPPNSGGRRKIGLGHTQFKRVMKHLHRTFGLGLGNDTADANRGRGNHVDVDSGGGECLEHGRRDARVRTHPSTDHRNPSDIALRRDLFSAKLRYQSLGELQAERQGIVSDGEGDVRGTVLGGVLDDHVDIDRPIGKRAKEAGRNTRTVWHA